MACASRKKIGRAAGWAGEGSGPARGEVGPGEKEKGEKGKGGEENGAGQKKVKVGCKGEREGERRGKAF